MKNLFFTLILITSFTQYSFTQQTCEIENCSTCSEGTSSCSQCKTGYHLATVSNSSQICEENKKNCYLYDDDKLSCSRCDYKYSLEKSNKKYVYYCVEKDPKISRGFYIVFFLVIGGSICAYFFYIVLTSNEFKNMFKKKKKVEDSSGDLENEEGVKVENEIQKENEGEEENKNGVKIGSEENVGSQRPLMDEEKKNSSNPPKSKS